MLTMCMVVETNQENQKSIKRQHNKHVKNLFKLNDMKQSKTE